MEPTAPAAPSRARTALAVTLLAVLYLWVFPYHTLVNNPNENVRVFMTVAVVDDGTFALNRIEREWGYVNDKSVRDTPLTEAIQERHVSDEVLRAAGVADDVLQRFHLGRPTAEDRALRVNLLYSSKAPGTSYLGVPAYWLLTRLSHRSTHLPPVAPVVAAAPAPVGAHAAPARRPELREPIERTRVVYFVRLFANVLPALVFAWFWYRFLGARTRSRSLADAAFFSTMAGSSLFAYSEVFASHAHNAMCLGAAIMALCTVRERDLAARAKSLPLGVHGGVMFLAGLFGAGATLFEYPAGIATAVVALWIVASNAERRRWLLVVAGSAVLTGAGAYVRWHSKKAAAVAAVVALGAYALTLRPRNFARLAWAGVGGMIPIALLMLYHKRCFGDAFKPGYSYLENQQFRTEIAQGFFGATAFSWDAGMRLWFDPAFGLIPSTFLFALTFAGLAAMLAWRPAGNALLDGSDVYLSRLTLARTALGGVLTFTAVKLALAIKAHPGALSHVDVGKWVVALTMAVLVCLSVVLPPAQRRDRALGAAILLICFGMTFLIGMMNNWRGGWQVGPRYLVTLVPALCIASLAGADAIYRSLHGSPALQRAVTVCAAGATYAAFLITGLPSATFPHVPTEYASPLFEMMIPVLRDGFVPHNAGHFLFDMKGAASMWGFGLAAAVMLALVLRGDERRPLAAVAHAVASLAVGVVLLTPMAVAARPEAAPVTRYVKSAWEPRPPDSPAGVAIPRARETAAEARARALRYSEAGDTGLAFEAWLRAIRAPR
jgi:hypothetical protein